MQIIVALEQERANGRQFIIQFNPPFITKPSLFQVIKLLELMVLSTQELATIKSKSKNQLLVGLQVVLMDNLLIIQQASPILLILRSQMI